MKTPSKTKINNNKKKTITGNKPVKIDVTPSLKETVIFSFGRMNPPTKGHAKLVSEMKKIDGDHIIHLSQTGNTKRNPLDYSDKLEFAKIAFGDIIQETTSRDIVSSLKSLRENYSKIILFVGGDRVDEFTKMFEHYNETEFQYESWEVRSAGNRRSDSDDIEGISASALREACVSQDAEKIRNCLPESLYDYTDDIVSKVAAAYSINESIKIVQRSKQKAAVNRVKDALKSATSRLKSK